jgi:hypothetical protein
VAQQDTNDVREVYTRYWAERQEMMQVWPDQLDHWFHVRRVDAAFCRTKFFHTIGP